MKSGFRSLVLATLVAVGIAAWAAAAAAAGITPLKADLLGSFFFHDCPAETPAGSLCLHDDVMGHLTGFGRTTGSFEVVFDAAAFDQDGCGPIRKQGSLVNAHGDRLDFKAEGRFCFSTVVALYQFEITGGAGRFAGASGSGSWLVPAPATFDGVAGTGDEILLGVFGK